MPHYPKPFFKKSRGLWYVEIDRKQHNLGPDRDDAFRRYHNLCRLPRQAVAMRESVAAVCDAFLEWVKRNRKEATYVFYHGHLRDFVAKHPRLAVTELRIFHVQQWIDARTNVSSGTKRNMCRCIQRAMRWAEEQGFIERSPLAYLKKPRGGQRDTVISDDQFEQIVKFAPNDDFRDVVIFAWNTGARAAEIMALERRHVDLERKRIVFPVAEEKMKRIPRIIYLNEPALEIVVRRLSGRNDRVFTTPQGRPWTPRRLDSAFSIVRTRMASPQLLAEADRISEADIDEYLAARQGVNGRTSVNRKFSDKRIRRAARTAIRLSKQNRLIKRFCLTNFRHTWCTRALSQGVDALTVGILMGHSDPSMVAKVYGHLSHAQDYLRTQVARASGESTGIAT